jgi:hypothetical protein
VGLRLGPYGGPRGAGQFRGTPVHEANSKAHRIGCPRGITFVTHLRVTPLSKGRNPLSRGRMARISPSRKSPKLTTVDSDRLLSTCTVEFRVFKTSPMRSATQIHDRRNPRKNLPGLGDFQRFFGEFEVNLSVATPLQGCDPLFRGSQPSYLGGVSYP